MGRYLRPHTLDDALGAMAAGRYAVLAGGTDFYPTRVGSPVAVDVLDISAVSALRGIREAEGGLRIGALATWSEIVATPLPRQIDCLKLAAREIGGLKNQNASTIAGNLCNASPAADGVPPLLAMNAEIELGSAAGERRVALG